jgi:hypothetical protein
MISTLQRVSARKTQVHFDVIPGGVIAVILPANYFSMFI